LDAILELQNALTHFKPEWRDEASKHRRVSTVLAAKIAGSPFLSEPELLFPRRWASHDCTSWTVRSTVALMREVELSLVGRSRIDMFRSRPAA
jgi:hypothetical protein